MSNSTNFIYLCNANSLGDDIFIQFRGQTPSTQAQEGPPSGRLAHCYHSNSIVLHHSLIIPDKTYKQTPTTAKHMDSINITQTSFWKINQIKKNTFIKT